MTQDKDYSFISVGSDDDDIVIQAGAVSSASPDVSPTTAAAPETEIPQSDFEQPLNPTADQLSNPSRVDEAADDAARKEYLKHQAVQQARRNANTMVTTEEDLHAAMPFARMQRVIVVVLLLLVVAAIVYWFFIRPLA